MPPSPSGGRPSWRTIEERTRLWLEDRCREGFARIAAAPSEERAFDAEGRITGMSAYHFHGIVRKLRVFRWLDRMRFDSVLDVGAGFETYPSLVRERYGVPTYSADLSHWMNLPFDAPALGTLDHSVSVSTTRLPFATGSFDLVMATEVLEHLVRPIEAIAEMLRVTRKYLLLTSLEAISVDRWRRLWSELHVDPRLPHVERNFFTAPQLRAVFGADAVLECVLFNPDLPVSAFASATDQASVYRSLRDRSTLVAAVRRAAARCDHAPGAMGVLVVKAKPGAEVCNSGGDESGLLEWLVTRTAADEDLTFRRIAEAEQFGRESQLPDRKRPVAAALLEHLACPECRGALVADGGMRCHACGGRFETEYGVPILYPKRWPTDRELEGEVREILCGGDSERWSVVERRMRALRRTEHSPGWLRRALWFAESLGNARA